MPVLSVPIMLDKERHIRFTFSALCRLEDTLGIPVADIGETLRGAVRLGQVRDLLFAGLYDDDKTITREKVEDLIGDIDRLGDIVEAIYKAIEGTFASEPGEPKKAPGTEPSPGPGNAI